MPGGLNHRGSYPHTAAVMGLGMRILGLLWLPCGVLRGLAEHVGVHIKSRVSVGRKHGTAQNGNPFQAAKRLIRCGWAALITVHDYLVGTTYASVSPTILPSKWCRYQARFFSSSSLWTTFRVSFFALGCHLTSVEVPRSINGPITLRIQSTFQRAHMQAAGIARD